MGIVALLFAALFFVHAGKCWEGRKHVGLTRGLLRWAALLDVLCGLYFMLAAIGHYAP